MTDDMIHQVFAWGLGGLLAVPVAAIVLGILTGRINLRGLLADRSGLSPSRAIALCAALFSATSYGREFLMQEAGSGPLPSPDNATVAALLLANGSYLLSKSGERNAKSDIFGRIFNSLIGRGRQP